MFPKCDHMYSFFYYSIVNIQSYVGFKGTSQWFSNPHDQLIFNHMYYKKEIEAV